MRIVGTYHFTVFGDGRKDELDINLARLKTPDPIIDGAIPTGIADVQVGPNPGGATGTLNGEILHLIFDIPPSSAMVTVDALFGND